MNHVLVPKDQFQKLHSVEREEWARTVGQRSTQLALNYALAEMTSLGFTPEQLKGVNLFIITLLNLSQAPAPSIEEMYPPQPLQEEKPVVATES